MSWLEWLGLIAFGAVAYGIDTAIRKRRSNALQAVASELGFSFQEEEGGLQRLEELAKFRLFKQHSPDVIRNILKGQRLGVPVLIFDYKYDIDYAEFSAPRNQTVAAFRVDHRTLPDFELRPEGIAQKLGALIGYQDIDFPEAPLFSARYLLQGTPIDSVRPLFHPGILRLLEEEGGWWIEGGGHWLLIYRLRKRLKAQKIEKFLREAEAIFAAFRLS